MFTILVKYAIIKNHILSFAYLLREFRNVWKI